MARLTLLLVPCPRVGPVYWRAVHDQLWQRGIAAYGARITSTEYLFPPYWLPQAAGVAAMAPAVEQLVLVGHAGGGALLPAIGRLLESRPDPIGVAGYVFVDAPLPADGRSRMDRMLPAQASALRAVCDDGFLPVVEPKLGVNVSADLLFQLRQERSPVLLDLWEESIPVPEQWPAVPCGTLGLSDASPAWLGDPGASVCRASIAGDGWQPLTNAPRVADALIELLRAMRIA